MGEKDSAEKYLEDYNDVFADIFNGFLFQGDRVITPNSLEASKVRTQYKADGTILHEQERDVAKFWKKRKVRIALCAIENQTDVDEDMPLRVMGYDGAAYREQMLDENIKERYPVVTIILYFGNRHWQQAGSLKEILKIPKELEPYVNDYKIWVFEVAWLTEQQIQMFQSDFRIVADYFTQMRKKKDYTPSKQTIKHVDAVLKMLSVFTKDQRFATAFEGENQEGKKVTNMCEVLDRIEKRGIELGIKQGITQGIAQGTLGVARKMLEAQETIEKIAQYTGLSYEKIRQLAK